MTDMDRRTFLKSTAGGLLIAFHIPGVASIRPYESKSTEAEINAWLTIDPDDTITIRVAQSEMGQGVFTSLPMIVAEELEVDWRKVKAEYASANRSLKENNIYGQMQTWGSGAVRRSREYLQLAGAEARERLIKAAAERWIVSPSECKADYGRVYHRASNRSLGYGELAAEASGLRVANVKIKTPEQFGLLGLPTKRLDVPAKVDGSAVFGIDVRLPDMVYAAVKHCPVYDGVVRNFKFNVIREMPGVIQAVRLEKGVAVVAESFWQAQKGANALPVDWTIGDSGKANSETWRSEFVEALDKPGVQIEEVGNVSRAMEVDAEKTMTSDYVVPYLSQAAMEPLNCTVHVQKTQVDIWVGTQSPDALVMLASRMTGVPAEQCFVHTCYLGGGFGRRSQSDFVQEALQIGMESGRPVQMIWTREDDQAQGQYRPMAAIRFKAGFDIDSNLIAYYNHSVTHSINAVRSASVRERGVDSSSIEGLYPMPYEIPQRDIRHSIKDTYLSTWYWRSVGHSQNGYARECFVDEMAEAAGLNPVTFRKRYLKGHKKILNALDVVIDKADWGKRMPAGSAQGLAVMESFGTTCAQVAEVSISTSGKLSVDRIVTVIDCGNLVNPLSAEEQVESSIIYGLTAALYGKLTVERGKVLETNFNSYHMVTLKDAPLMETHFALSGGDHWGGMGEPALPTVAPAVCNAIYQITRRRIRSLPISDYYLQRA